MCLRRIELALSSSVSRLLEGSETSPRGNPGDHTPDDSLYADDGATFLQADDSSTFLTMG